MGLFTGESICGIQGTSLVAAMVFRQQKNVTAARLAGGKHIYIKLTKLTKLAHSNVT